MEQEEDKKSKKLNDDTVIFLRKRSETEAPRYAARLRAYVDLHRKRSRAAAARRRSEHHERKSSGTRKKGEPDQKEKNMENSINSPNVARKSNCGMSGEHPGAEDDRMSRRRGGDKSGIGRGRSRSAEPSDRCGRRRRRRRRSCSGRLPKLRDLARAKLLHRATAIRPSQHLGAAADAAVVVAADAGDAAVAAVAAAVDAAVAAAVVAGAAAAVAESAAVAAAANAQHLPHIALPLLIEKR